MRITITKTIRGFFYVALVYALLFSASSFATHAGFSGLLRPTNGPTSLVSTDRAAVVLIHGWNPKDFSDAYATVEWQDLMQALRLRIDSNSVSAKWKLLHFDWHHDAATGSRVEVDFDQASFDNASQAAKNGFDSGPLMAQQIKSAAPNLRRLVLIAHSAGSWLARRAANVLLSDPDMPYLQISVVLLDPFIPGVSSSDTTGLTPSLMTSLSGHANSDRIYRLENYFARDLTDINWNFLSDLGGAGATSNTFNWNGRHINGLRVDFDPSIGSYFGAPTQLGRAYDGHSGPIEFYTDTVLADTPGNTLPDGLVKTREWDILQFGFYRSIISEEVYLLPRITDLSLQTTGIVGAPATFSVAANRAANATYQWFENGTACCNSSPTYTIPVTTLSDNGKEYVVRITNTYGSTFSEKLKLQVTATPRPTISAVGPDPLNAMPLPNTQQITISGNGFNNESRLYLYDGVNAPYENRVPIFDSPMQLRYDIQVGPSAGTWTVEISNNGVFSAPYTFYVQATSSVPATPPTPAATDGSHSTRVVISWLAVAGATSFQIYRCTGISTSTCSLTGTSSNASVDDTNGVSGTIYYYRVKACNAVGCSAFSEHDSGFRGTANGSAPSVVSASDGVYSSGVLVNWSAANGADSYELWRATSLAGTKTSLASNSVYTTYADVQVETGRIYYYWIKACNYTGLCSAYSAPDSGYAGQASVGTLNATNTPDPPNVDNGVSINVGELAWVNGGGATSYDVYFGTDSSPDSGELIGSTAATNRNIPQLAYSTTYYWRVDARANGQTVTGPIWQFTTRAQSAGEPPNRAVSPSPAHYSEGIVPVGATLQWVNGGGATIYDVYFGRQVEPGIEEHLGETTATSFPLPALERGKTYFWRIKARNAAGIAKGDVWRFTVEPQVPSAAFFPYPPSGELDRSPYAFNLSWQDPADTAKNYDIYFGTDATPDASEFIGNSIETKWQTPNLQPNTTYYWQIASRNNAGVTLGPVWSFTTWATSPGILNVTEGGFSAVGNAGGPFQPSTKSYTLKNIGQQALNYTITNARSWLQLSPRNGTIPAGGETVVVATLGADALALPPGYHSDTIMFENSSNFRGTDQRAVSLAIGVPLQAWDVAKLAGGLSSYLAIKSDGSLHGWGLNQNSELGIGVPAQLRSPAPIRLGVRTDWVNVAMGTAHSLALTNDGRLFGWGRNNGAQLGLGDSILRSTPTQVGLDSDWVQIAAGDNHSLALKVDGRLFSFGVNVDGQLGHGDFVNRSTPNQVGSDSDWASIIGSLTHSAAIKRDGRMFSWGFKAAGNGTTVKTPTQVGTFSDWKVVAGIGNHRLALRLNGTLYSWGSNGTGVLGLGDLAQRNSPVQVGSDLDWVQISASETHSLALKSDGRLYGWGDNAYGQLGLGDKTNRLVPTLILQNANIDSILATHGSSHIILNDGSVFSWGRNDDGKLGLGHAWLGNSVHVPSPVKVDMDWALGISSAAAVISPSAPALNSISNGPGRTTLNFSEPTSNGGSAIISYTATCTASGQVTRTATGSGSPLTVVGLTAGVAYTCSLTATNGAGLTSGASGMVSVTPTTANNIAPLLMYLLD